MDRNTERRNAGAMNANLMDQVADQVADDAEPNTIYIGPSVEYVARILARNGITDTRIRIVAGSHGRPVIEAGADLEPGMLAICGPLVADLVSAVVSEGMMADTQERIARR